MALQARSQNRRVLLVVNRSQPPHGSHWAPPTRIFVHLPPNSLDYRDRYGLQQMRYGKAIVPISKQSGILCVVQLFEQRIVALAVTRTHARFENRLRELHAPTEPQRLAPLDSLFLLW